MGDFNSQITEEIDEKKHHYEPNVKQYVFDLFVQHRNPKGELIIEEEKTKEQKDEIEFQNQVYGRVFHEVETQVST